MGSSAQLGAPLAYLITFSCYGARLHGEDKATVDRDHNTPQGRYVPEDRRRTRAESRLMNEPPYRLNPLARTRTLRAIQEVCTCRGWPLYAAHVRSNHVHIVVAAKQQPEAMMTTFKAYATRALSQSEAASRTKRWSRHGSTRWLWNPEQVNQAITYVLHGQGGAMACYGALSGQ
jgi:REP element-mobilizing transposase RayT